MQPWHYYVVMGLCAATGGALQALAMRNPDFAYYSGVRKFFTRAFCFAVPAVLVFLPYMAWTISGFRQADARTAEKLIIEQYLEGGAQKVEADFIVKDRNTLTGMAKVTLADGTMITLPCQAEMGEQRQFLVFCT